MQELVKDIWFDKYRAPEDTHPKDTLLRVRDAIDEHFTMDSDILLSGTFIPAGRILAGAGTKNRVTLMNCYVMGTIDDSMTGIGDVLKDSMLTMQQGGGIGLDFSTLRPEFAKLSTLGSNAWASGPLPFMDMWDAMCRTIMSAGSRRGAMMATMRCDHPDIIKFIEAKHTPGRLTNFNLSVLITDNFMDCVAKDLEWNLYFNVPKYDTGNNIYQTLPARELWDLILKSTYEYSEPGVIFIDRVNNLNNLSYCETISATNPCGEQPLPPNGCCNLGAINLANLVKDSFTSESRFSYVDLMSAVRYGVQFLDEVIDKTNYPLQAQKDEELSKRRIGLGITGLHDAMLRLGITYGNNEECIKFIDGVMKTLFECSYEWSSRIAEVRGSFPLFELEKFKQTDSYKNLPTQVQNLIEKHGLRNGVLLTIAPTGTTSMWPGENISSGLEPVFRWSMNRKVLQPDGTHKEYENYNKAYLDYYAHLDEDLGTWKLPSYFVTSADISVDDHVAIQSQCQKWIDASISKTLNCPEDMTFEEFKKVYETAYELGCKGCTTYRPSKTRGSILSDIEPEKPLEQDDSPRQRATSLEGKTYKIKWPTLDSAFYVIINDMGGKPFEIFIVSKNTKYLEWTTALTRMISAIMRTHGDISFVYQELQEVNSTHDSAWIGKRYIGSIVAYIGLIIENHVKGLEGSPLTLVTETTSVSGPAGSRCPSCDSPTLIHSEGCETCTQCGYSNCG